MKSSNIKYLPALDHIRFFAASIIIVYHGILFFGNFYVYNTWVYTNNPLYTLFVEGHTAVALFMVLSGFIFTIGALGHRVGYFGFLRNRVLRIYPLYIFLIIVGILVSPKGTVTILAVLKTLFLFIFTKDGLNLGPISSVFWTIAVEFQFYLVFPVLLYLLQSYSLKSLLLMIALALAIRTTAFFLGANAAMMAFSSIAARIDQFLLGMIAAQIFSSVNRSIWKYSLAPSIILVIMTLFFYNKLGGWPQNEPWKLIWPTIEGFVWAFFLMSYVGTVRDNSNIIFKSMSRLGELSFSIYLIHFNVWYIVYVNDWFMDLGSDPVKNALVNSLLIVFPLTVAISFVTFNLIEKPFLRLRGRYLKPLNPAVTAPSSAAVSQD